MPNIQKLIQVAHAANYSGFRNQEPPSPVNLVICSVKDEQELWEIYRALSMKDLKIEPFFESYKETGLTAIATSPIYSKKQRALFSKFSLLQIGEN